MYWSEMPQSLSREFKIPGIMLNSGFAGWASDNLPPWAALAPWQEECELCLDPLLVAISAAAARLQDRKQSRRCLHLPLRGGGGGEWVERT